MKAWYLGHSGFAVATADQFLIFDYYLDSPANGGLEQGVITVADLEGKRVTVFSSHRHPDHYNPCVFGWRAPDRNILYLLSDDISASGADVRLIGAGQTVQAREDLSVRTLLSTDEGVAFVVTTPEGVIYHAGDLNWWHWNGESQGVNRKMGENYRGQIDLLRGERIDLAFVPADPRLEDKYALGLDYFMQTVNAQACVPMHLWDKYDVCKRLLQEPCTEAYRDRLVCYTHRGEQVIG